MKETNTGREINITSSEVYDYNKKHKKRARKKSENKFIKALYAAFMIAASTGVVIISLFTTSINSVTLFAKNANSLTFYVGFDEKNAEIEYVLEDQNQNKYYPYEDYYMEQDGEEEDLYKYIHFDGLSPNTEYIFRVTAFEPETNEPKTLYTGSYFTMNDDITVDAYASVEENMLWGEVKVSGVDSFYSVIIEDSLGKKIFTKDFEKETQDEWQSFEIPGENLKDSKYSMYVKYKRNVIFQQSILMMHHHDKFIDVYAELKDGIISFSCYSPGYEDLLLQITDTSQSVLYETYLSGIDNYFTLTGYNDDLYYFFLKQNKEVVYSGEIHKTQQIPPSASLIDWSFINDELSFIYEISNYEGTHSIRVLNSLGEQEFGGTYDHNRIDLTINDLSDTEYTIIVEAQNQTLLSEKVTKTYEPYMDYSYSFQYGVLTFEYFLENFDISNPYTLNIVDPYGNTAYSNDFYFIESSPLYNKSNAAGGPRTITLVVRDLYEESYTITIVQNGNEIFSEEVVQDNPELSPEIGYSFVDGSLQATIFIQGLGENCLLICLEDEEGNIIERFDVTENNTIEVDNLDSERQYNFVIYLNEEALYSSQISAQENPTIGDFKYEFKDGVLSLYYTINDASEGHLVQIKNASGEVVYTQNAQDISNSIDLRDLNDEQYTFHVIVQGNQIYKTTLINTLSVKASSQYSFINGKLELSYTLQNLKSSYSLLILDEDNDTQYSLSSELDENTIIVNDLPNRYYYLQIYIGNDVIYSTTLEQTLIPVVTTNYTFLDGNLDLNYSVEYFDGIYNISITSLDGIEVYSDENSDDNGSISLKSLDNETYIINFYYEGDIVYTEELIPVFTPEVSLEYTFQDGILYISYLVSNLSNQYNVKVCTMSGDEVFGETRTTDTDEITLTSLAEGDYFVIFYVGDDVIYSQDLIQLYSPSVSTRATFVDGQLKITYSVAHFVEGISVRVFNSNADIIHEQDISQETGTIELDGLWNDSSITFVFLFEDEIIHNGSVEQVIELVPQVSSFDYSFKDGILYVNYTIEQYPVDYSVQITTPDGDEVFFETRTNEDDTITLTSLDEGDLLIIFNVNDTLIYTQDLLQLYSPNVNTEPSFVDGLLNITYSIAHFVDGISLKIFDPDANIILEKSISQETGEVVLTDLYTFQEVDFVFLLEDEIIHNGLVEQTITFVPQVTSFDYTFQDGILYVSYAIEQFPTDYLVQITTTDGVEVFKETRTTKNDTIILRSLEEGDCVISFDVLGKVVYTQNLIQSYSPRITTEPSFVDGLLDIEYSIEHYVDGISVKIFDPNANVIYEKELSQETGNIIVRNLITCESIDFAFILDDEIIHNGLVEQTITPVPTITNTEHTFIDGILNMSYTIENFESGIVCQIFDVSGSFVDSLDVTKSSGTLVVQNLSDYQSITVIFVYNNDPIYTVSVDQEITPDPAITSFQYTFEDGALDLSYSIINVSSTYNVRISDNTGTDVYNENLETLSHQINLMDLGEGDLNFFITYNDEVVYEKTLNQTYSPSITSLDATFLDGVITGTYSINHYTQGITIQLLNTNSGVLNTMSLSQATGNFSFPNLSNYSIVTISFVYDNNDIYSQSYNQEYSPVVTSFDATFEDGVIEGNYVINHYTQGITIQLLDSNSSVINTYNTTQATGELTIPDLSNYSSVNIKFVYNNETIYTESLVQQYTPSVTSFSATFLDGVINGTYTIEHFTQGITIQLLDSNSSIITSLSATQASENINITDLTSYSVINVNFVYNDVSIYSESIDQEYTPAVSSFDATFLDGTITGSYSVDHYSNGITIQILDPNNTLITSVDITTTPGKLSIPDLGGYSTVNIKFVYNNDVIYSSSLDQEHTPIVTSLSYTFVDGSLNATYSIVYYVQSIVAQILDSLDNLIATFDISESSGSIDVVDLLNYETVNIKFVYNDNIIYSASIEQEYTPEINSFNGTFLDGTFNGTYSIDHYSQGITIQILDSNDSVINTLDATASSDDLTVPDLTTYEVIIVNFVYKGDIIYSQEFEQVITPDPTGDISGSLVYGTLSFDYSVQDWNDSFMIRVYGPKFDVVYSEETSNTSGNIIVPDMFYDSYTISLLINNESFASSEISDSSPALEVGYEHLLVNGQLDMTVYVDDVPENNSLTAKIMTLTGDSVYSCGVTQEFSIELDELDPYQSYIFEIVYGDISVFNAELEYVEDYIELPEVLFVDEDGYTLPEFTYYGFPITYSIEAPDVLEVSGNELVCLNPEDSFEYTLYCSSDTTDMGVVIYSKPMIIDCDVGENYILYNMSPHDLFESFIYTLNGIEVEPSVDMYATADGVMVQFDKLESNTDYIVEILFGDSVVLTDYQTTLSSPEFEFSNIVLSYDSVSFNFAVTNNPYEQNIYLSCSEAELIESSGSDGYILTDLTRETSYLVEVMADEVVIGSYVFTTTDYPDLVVNIENEFYNAGSYTLDFTLENTYDRNIVYYVNDEPVELGMVVGETPGQIIYEIFVSYPTDPEQIIVKFKEIILVNDVENIKTLFTHQAQTI